MCYPICGMVCVKDPLLLMEKVTCEEAAVGFLPEWSIPTYGYFYDKLYNHKLNVLSVSLYKTFC